MKHLNLTSWLVSASLPFPKACEYQRWRSSFGSSIRCFRSTYCGHLGWSPYPTGAQPTGLVVAGGMGYTLPETKGFFVCFVNEVPMRFPLDDLP